jgi:hypothetical protein
MWDKENDPSSGWYAWDQYVDFLRQNGCKHTAEVSTTVKFDANTAYPKLLFKVAGWIPDEKEAMLRKVMADPSIPKLLNAMAEVVEHPESVPAEPTPASAAPVTPAAPSQPPAGAASSTAAAAPSKRGPGRPSKPATTAPVVHEVAEEDGFAAVDAAAASAPQKAAPATKPVAPAAQQSEELKALLGSWDLDQ